MANDFVGDSVKCRLYVDPASVEFPPHVYPFSPVYRRNKTLEKKFKFGIYDAGINMLAKKGSYEGWWQVIDDLPAGWEQVIPDFPYDVLVNCKNNTRTPEQCLRESDEMIEKYHSLPQMIPSIQYIFGSAGSLRERLNNFFAVYPEVKRFGIGNTCKLTNNQKIKEIAIIMCNVIPDDCFPHIFGCPTRLLRILNQDARFKFSIDTNKFFWGTYNGMRVKASGKGQRTQFLIEFIKKNFPANNLPLTNKIMVI